MATVREATFELFRAHGMTTIFGNPGSTELPMLADFPEDFTYVLGLQELVVMGMADGYAQASRKPTHVNLHTGPGVGNAVGGILNAQANKSPLVITAGQQVRPQITMEALLTNRDATVVPQPYVKYSHEPPRAQDVPGALARAIAHAMLPPRGPAFVSIPMDDWTQEADEDRAERAAARHVNGRAAADPDALAAVASRLGAAANPVLVVGADVDAAGAWDHAVALAEKQRLAVWAPPAPSGSRLRFAQSPPQFVGTLPPAIGPVADVLKAHDLVLVIGSSVFSYYPYMPGPLLGPDTALVLITADPDEAARAPMGDAIVGDVGLALERLVELVPAAEPPQRTGPEARPQLGEPPAADPPDRLSGSQAMAALAAAWPQDAIAVVESPSTTVSLRNRLRLSHPGSYYTGASGGLGFGIAAAVGVQMAQPDRPVVCVLGEGSAQYGITALWSAVAYKVPVTFLVLRNDEYAILKWFAMLEGVAGAPGLDLPALDVAAVARAYGMQAREVTGADELTHTLRETIAADDGPRLVQVPVAPGMWLE
jgi:benzoylformate decarboxylase